MVLKSILRDRATLIFLFSARVRPGGFIALLAHGENDLNFGTSGLGFIPDIAAVTPEDFSG
jgi:hypothetical protein